MMAISFEQAFAAEFMPLYAYLRRRLGSALAEDVAAETFALAYTHWERFDQARPLRPWLYGIAANVAHSSWRSERRMLRAYARSGIDPVLSEVDSIVERADAASQKRELAAALASLRSIDRDILLLHAWAALTDAEIAEALGLPIGTVKSKLHRARQRVRNHVGGDGQVATPTLTRPSEEL